MKKVYPEAGQRKEENYSSKYGNQMWINIVIAGIKILNGFILQLQLSTGVPLFYL